MFHQTAYALLTATVVFRSMWVMESQLRPALEARRAGKSTKLLKTMWTMVATGMFRPLHGNSGEQILMEGARTLGVPRRVYPMDFRQPVLHRGERMEARNWPSMGCVAGRPCMVASDDRPRYVPFNLVCGLGD
jgi:hypothetical protein